MVVKKTMSRMIAIILVSAFVLGFSGQICEGLEIPATTSKIGGSQVLDEKTTIASTDGNQNQLEETIVDMVRLDVPSFDQQALDLDTGCEIVALGMMINYSTTADVYDLVSETPRSTDPNLGFRGDPFSTGGFTVFPSALLEVTENYLDNAIDMTGETIEDIKEQLQHDSPVVAWVNGLGFNVHAITISGYDVHGLYYNDPWTGVKDAFLTYDDFYEIWNKPIYDTRYEISYSPRKALSYTHED